MRTQPGNTRPTLRAVSDHPVMSLTHLDDYELWQTARRLSPRTITERSRVLRQFYADTRVQPAHAQSIDIMRWIADHPDWSQGTVCAYYAYLNGWYKWLQAQDLRVDNPMVKIGAPKTPERLPRPVSDGDVRALLTSSTHTRTHAMILLAALQGLRVHEIAKVRAEDIDVDAGTLTVRGKGGSLHALPLHPRVAEWAWRMAHAAARVVVRIPIPAGRADPVQERVAGDRRGDGPVRHQSHPTRPAALVRDPTACGRCQHLSGP